MKYLIIGGTGVIGYKILQHIRKEDSSVKFTFLNNKEILKNSHFLNIENLIETKNLIKKISPDIVIHCSALSNIDFCENNKRKAESINVLGTKNIVEGCKESNSKIVYISTSFVFDGKKKYSENDNTSPSTFYGFTKFKGEEIIKDSNIPFLILRTDQPYSWIEQWQHTNSVIRVIDSLKKKKIFYEVNDWYNVPTYVPDFVNATMKLIKLKKEGVFHVSGSDFLNRYDWAILTAKIFQLNPDLIKAINSSSLNLSAKRVNGNLSNEKLFRETGIKMRGIKEGLMEMFKAKDVSQK
jgi:dTDP-4-dehydrorhamnose reductase